MERLVLKAFENTKLKKIRRHQRCRVNGQWGA